MTRRDLFAAVTLALIVGALSLSVDLVAVTLAAPQQTRFEHKACADCIVMHVDFVPPKP